MTRFSIMIPTVGEREDRFKTLVSKLAPQVKAYNGDVEVLVFWNNFQHKLATIRQALIADARGTYTAFIDDDDDVPNYYCDRIMHALESNPDQVGWRMQLYYDGVKTKPTFHSIRYAGWSEDAKGYRRNCSHLNPVKREIALQIPFTGYNGPEDVAWAERVAPLIKTEAYIDDPMYFYHCNTNDSIWSGRPRPKRNYFRPELPKFFRHHPDSQSKFIA